MATDLVVLNGNIITMNRRGTIAGGLVVRDGRIAVVGTSDRVDRSITRRTQVIDLKGKTVTPGLIDTHIHVASVGSVGAGVGLGFLETGKVLDISRTSSIKEIVDLIGRRARESRASEWILTGWPSERPLVENRIMTRWDLDSVSPDNPVLVGGYPFVVANGYLLKMAGITKDTAAPPGGEIEKDPSTGEPTGRLAFQAVYQLLPRAPLPTVEETEAAIRAAQRTLASSGITAYKDAGLRVHALKAYQNLRMRDELLCRTHMMYTWLWTVKEARDAADWLTPYGDDMLMLRSVKLSLDGSIESGTAWSYNDWFTDFTTRAEGRRGYPKIAPDMLPEMVEILHEARLQVCCHCQGERAIDVYLDAIERALERYPRQNCRHTIIHCTLPSEEAIRRMARLGNNIAVEPQSVWLRRDKWAWGGGPDRSRRFLPFKTWLRHGLIVGNGCDFPPETHDPMFGIWCACTRESEEGRHGPHPYGIEERLTIQEALHTYTMGGAACLFSEDRIGSLEPGKCADFVVWDTDPYAVPPGELKHAKALLTVVGGRTVYQSSAW